MVILARRVAKKAVIVSGVVGPRIVSEKCITNAATALAAGVTEVCILN